MHYKIEHGNELLIVADLTFNFYYVSIPYYQKLVYDNTTNDYRKVE